MRVAIVGGGMAGLTLARCLRARGLAPAVIERAPAGITVPGPIMMPYHAFDALQDAGVLGRIRAAGRDIAPQAPDGRPVAIAVGRQDVLQALRDGLEVAHETELVDLVCAPGAQRGSRVCGLRVRDASGEREEPADLVVGADGVRSRVRELAGIECTLQSGEFAGLSFRSPVALEEPFAMAYQSDGRQVTAVSWPGGTAGTFQIDPIGAEAALAPGLAAFVRTFSALLPAAAPALAAIGEADWGYREVTEVRCRTWWAPGVVLIGEAAHAINPETGVGAGLGLGDALALAIAIAAAGADTGSGASEVGGAAADRAAADYETWRRPAVAPYEHIGTASVRMPQAPAGAPKPAAERWPPA